MPRIGTLHRRTLTALVALPLCLSNCGRGSVKQSDVRRLPFSLDGHPQDGFVSASGHWVRTTSRQRSGVPVLNAVQIVCSRNQGTCIEAVAGLHSDLDPLFREATGGGLLLTSEITEFSIHEWSALAIRATAQPRAADIELRISMPEKTVSRTAIETGARGASGADPTPEVWSLE
jgi:hypothetical protein